MAEFACTLDDVRRRTGDHAVRLIGIIAEGEGNVLRLAAAQDQLGSDTTKKGCPSRSALCISSFLSAPERRRIVAGR